MVGAPMPFKSNKGNGAEISIKVITILLLSRKTGGNNAKILWSYADSLSNEHQHKDMPIKPHSLST